MSHRLFVTIRGDDERSAIQTDVAYGSAQGLGLMADALTRVGVTGTIYPDHSGDEAPFIMPKLAPAVRLVLHALNALAQEASDDALESRVTQAFHDLKTLEHEGKERAKGASA